MNDVETATLRVLLDDLAAAVHCDGGDVGAELSVHRWSFLE
jgi:hypothetical protein